MIVRDARPAELAEIGDLRVAAYETGGFLSDASHYGETLRTLGHDGTGQILVAVNGETEAILGTVMLQLWPDAGHVVRGPDEAEVRALAVAPEARGRGVGRALLRAVTDRARASGCGTWCCAPRRPCSPRSTSTPRPGSAGMPERDWQPVPGFTLLAYGREAVPPDRAGRAAGLRLPGPFRLHGPVGREAGPRRPGPAWRRTGRLAGRDLVQLLVQRAEQEVQGQAHAGDHEEPEQPRVHLAGGARRGQHAHWVTLSRSPANRSSSGNSVSTTDLARW